MEMEGRETGGSSDSLQAQIAREVTDDIVDRAMDSLDVVVRRAAIGSWRVSQDLASRRVPAAIR